MTAILTGSRALLTPVTHAHVSGDMITDIGTSSIVACRSRAALAICLRAEAAATGPARYGQRYLLGRERLNAQAGVPFT